MAALHVEVAVEVKLVPTRARACTAAGFQGTSVDKLMSGMLFANC